MFIRILCYISIVFILWTQSASADEKLDKFLYDAKYTDGIEYFTKEIKNKSENEKVFALAILQFIKGIENLSQDLYKCGLDSSKGKDFDLPFLRLPVPENSKPQKITSSDFKNMIDRFYTSMSDVDKTLDLINDKDFKTKIDLAKIRIDANGDGIINKDEFFHVIYTSYNPAASSLLKKNKSFNVKFDLADAYWLRGYANLLMSICDIILSYDIEEFFQFVSPVFFPALNKDNVFETDRNFERDIVNFIAAIHMMRLNVADPKRFGTGFNNIKKVITLSRKSWELIKKETDNDLEWIPNIKQKSVTGIKFSKEMIDGWEIFLKEIEDIIDGKKLLAHWNIKKGTGINVKKIIDNPPVFDIVMLAHGYAFLPYLEKGEISSPSTWDMLMRTFHGDFLNFAIWIN